MTTFLAIAASNVIFSGLLALLTIAVTRVWRSPQLAHGLWLLVLLKLITPPLVSVSPPADWFATGSETTDVLGPSPATTPYAVISENDEAVSLPEPGLATEPSGAASTVESREIPAAIAIDDSVAPAGDGSSIDATATVAAEPQPASFHWPTVVMVVMIVWFAGALAYVTIVVRRCLGFRRILANSTAANAEIKAAADRLALALGLRRCPPVRMVEATVPPLVWRLGRRPLVVLPARLLGELAAARRDALLAHELAHVRRHDDLVRWLEVAVLLAHWWNPLAWYARRKLREAEEECCDAWVVWALPGERKSYGQAMLATIEFLSDGPKLPLLAASAFGGSFYKRRIEMIMKRNVNRKISWTALGMIVLLAVSVMPMVAQTTETNDGQNSTPQDASGSSDAINATSIRTDETSTVADPALGGNARPSEEQLLQRISRLEELLKERGNGSGEVHRGQGDRDAVDSSDTVLERVKRLEELYATRQARTERTQHEGGSRTATTTVPAVPNFNVSPYEREQELQAQLLELDVAAAQSEVEQAKVLLANAVALQAKRMVSELEVQKHRAPLRQKEIQLQRAKTVLELFKQQVERKREEAAGVQRQPTPQDNKPANRDAGTQDRNRELAEAIARVLYREKLAGSLDINQSLSKDLERMHNSSDEREQNLQRRLLYLDVEAAQAEIEQARAVLDRTLEANKNAPGAVSELTVKNQRTTLRQKEIQLQRAQTIFEIFKRQVERQREEAARSPQHASSREAADSTETRKELDERGLVEPRADQDADRP